MKLVVSFADTSVVFRTGREEAEASPAWRLLKAVLVTTSGLLMLGAGLWMLGRGLQPALALCALGAILALYPLGVRL